MSGAPYYGLHVVTVVDDVVALGILCMAYNKVSLKCDLRADDWIVDSGCTKHMNGNRRLFTTYKEYDGGHVVFWSNLKGKVIGGANFSHNSTTITNVEHVSALAFNLISVVNVSDEGYPKSVKDARVHPIEQVIGELNERTLSQKHLEGNALDPWILALKQGEQRSRGARLKISTFYLDKDIYLQVKYQDPAFLI
ncbi:hypothetical protein Tco_0554843 [Tanacetum coccineum]